MCSETVLITGASRGIGRAMALAFAQKGYAVAANFCQNKAMAQSLQKEITALGGKCLLLQADVSRQEQVEEMFRQAQQQLGDITILINNAAIAQQQLFTDITAEQWRQMFAVNVDGVYHCCQAALPGMIHRKSGRILNIASMWGEVGGSCEVAYSASKGAVIALTKALAKELALSGITVNCLSPGMINTDMIAHLSPEDRAITEEEIPMGYSGQPADVAQAALFLCSPQASYITGQILRINGGMVV